MTRCECPYLSMDHAENECPNRAVYRVTREYRQLLLCPDCTLPGDVRTLLSDDNDTPKGETDNGR